VAELLVEVSDAVVLVEDVLLSEDVLESPDL
jgi:hypothetical protein